MRTANCSGAAFFKGEAVPSARGGGAELFRSGYSGLAICNEKLTARHDPAWTVAEKLLVRRNKYIPGTASPGF